MPWYLFEPDKRPPFVVPEKETDNRPFVAVVIWGLMFVLMAASIVSLFAGWFVLCYWAIGLTLVLYVAGRFVLPD